MMNSEPHCHSEFREGRPTLVDIEFANTAYLQIAQALIAIMFERFSIVDGRVTGLSCDSPYIHPIVWQPSLSKLDSSNSPRSWICRSKHHANFKELSHSLGQKQSFANGRFGAFQLGLMRCHESSSYRPHQAGCCRSGSNAERPQIDSNRSQKGNYSTPSGSVRVYPEGIRQIWDL